MALSCRKKRWVFLLVSGLNIIRSSLERWGVPPAGDRLFFVLCAWSQHTRSRRFLTVRVHEMNCVSLINAGRRNHRSEQYCKVRVITRFQRAIQDVIETQRPTSEPDSGAVLSRIPPLRGCPISSEEASLTLTGRS